MGNFFQTDLGKILKYVIHEHANGSQLIKSATTLLIEEDLTKEKQSQYLNIILKGNKRCNDAIDYLYEKIKQYEQDRTT